jgi:hypothetical protein
MNDIMKISQDCLSLAIDRCDVAGLSLKNKRQRMIIKGAIRQTLEMLDATGGSEEMDRSTADKLESNVSTLKSELDNYYLNGLTPEVTALAERICELAGGHSAELEALDLHRQRANELVKRVQDLERLLESLTPGGSEFAGDPQSCARWVRDRLASVGKLAAERNRYQGQAAALANALQAIYDGINDEWHPAFRDDLLTDQDRTLLVKARTALDARKGATE